MTAITIPDTVPLVCAVLYLFHEYDDEGSRKRQVVDLFYAHGNPDYWEKLIQALNSDDNARQCYEAASKAVGSSTIERQINEPNYEIEGTEEKRTEVYIISFLAWAEKAGYKIPQNIRSEIQDKTKLYFQLKFYRDQQKIEFPEISIAEFKRRMEEPLWFMSDALLYLLGVKTSANAEKKYGFLKYKSLVKKIRPYAEDALKIKELNLYDYKDQSPDGDQSSAEEKREKSFFCSKVKPKEFIEWAVRLPLSIPMLSIFSDKQTQWRSTNGITKSSLNFEFLLHPLIIKSAYKHYLDGHYRDAVLNSVIAIFDYIREKTSLTEDGDKLIGKAFAPKDPYIILSELETESGQCDQKGFMQIFQGAYQGIRNPKAHSLSHDLTMEKASQYLVFASLLARRLDEAQFPKKVTDGKAGASEKVLT